MRETNETSLFVQNNEKIIADIQEYNLFSDVFAGETLRERDACRDFLRIILTKHDLEIRSVKTQYVVNQPSARGARFDVLAEDSENGLYEIEIQNSDSCDHMIRVRFYASMIDSSSLSKGEDYHNLPEVTLIYITKRDFLKRGKTTYHIDKVIRETGEKYDDRQYIIFINAEVDDGSEIARLMNFFLTADPDNRSFGALSDRVRFLKAEKEGQAIMCEVTQKYYDKGRAEGKAETIQNVMQNYGISFDEACRLTCYTEEEKEAIKQLLNLE